MLRRVRRSCVTAICRSGNHGVDMNMHKLQQLERRIAAHRERLLSHSIYGTVNSIGRLRAFMETHVFAVWDFMSLLKALQRALTCVSVPWLPTSDTNARRLVNEIVLSEESDEDGESNYTSHFELYLQAMSACGANTQPALRLCERLQHGDSLSQAMLTAKVGQIAQEFVHSTFEIIGRDRPSEIAAAFTFGREDVIPSMFRQFVGTLCETSPTHFQRFRYYLDRHIELDSDDHGPKALQVVAAICLDDADEWAAAERAAIAAITARQTMWDQLAAQIVNLP